MIKKYLIIGNPVKHSLSPKIHNHWFNENKINAIYEKKEVLEHELKDIVDNVRNEEIFGVNITVPFKEKIIPYLDKLSKLSEKGNGGSPPTLTQIWAAQHLTTKCLTGWRR